MPVPGLEIFTPSVKTEINLTYLTPYIKLYMVDTYRPGFLLSNTVH